jgi:hypothetical protein
MGVGFSFTKPGEGLAFEQASEREQLKRSTSTLAAAGPERNCITQLRPSLGFQTPTISYMIDPWVELNLGRESQDQKARR